jgi:hypothetical protein
MPSQAGPVADELARRLRPPANRVQSYGEAEFEIIVVAARRMFRAALLRIETNAEHLHRWRRAEFIAGTQQWLLGEGLDHLAQNGDVPATPRPKPALRRTAAASRSCGATASHSVAGPPR